VKFLKKSLKVKTTYFFADSLHLHRKKQPSFSTTSMARIDVLAGMVDETKPLMGENGRQEGKEEGQRKSGLLFCSENVQTVQRKGRCFFLT